MSPPPKIHDIRTIATGKFFNIQQVDLGFGGQNVTYERISTKNSLGAVFIIASTATDLVLIREYMTGTERYELSLPKGAIDTGETPEQAARRELIEETGYRAQDFSMGRKIYANSAYMTSFSYYVFASGLTAGKAEGGDEVEPLEVVLWPLDNLKELLASDAMQDARSQLGVSILSHQLIEAEKGSSK